MSKGQYIYQHWRSEQVAADIHSRAQTHILNIRNSLNTEQVEQGYRNAIRYYETLKNRFANQLALAQNNEANKVLTQFKTDVNRMVQQEASRGTVDKMLQIFSNVDKEGNGASLIDTLTSYFLKNSDIFAKNYNQCITKINRVKARKEKDYQDTIQEIINNFDAIATDVKQDQGFVQSIREILKQVSGKQGINFDTSDLINKIIIPNYRTYLTNYLNKNSKKNSLGKRTKFAAGFMHEGVIYQGVSELFNNMKITHEGAKGGARDITLAPLGSPKHQQIDVDVLLNQIFTKQGLNGSSVGIIATKTFDDILTNNNINAFGIQVKNSMLTSKDNYSDLTHFERISNHQEYLTEFRTTIPLIAASSNTRAVKIDEEHFLDDELYALRVMQAIEFLSETHRIIKVMGYTNIGYAEKNKFIWTDKLLTRMKNEKKYLSFMASIGLGTGYNTNFTAAVGIRSFKI